jgi:NAD(P)-dependent dehydrogenase (short-subunit alcohol dehydrogenase family)
VSRVIVVTGTESAPGTALADYLYRAGHRVYRLDATHYLPEAAGEEEPVVSCDALEAAVSDYVTHVVNREGRLDALVNVAGYGLAGVVESATAGEVHDLYAHNLFFPHAATRAALSVMAVQERGAIVNVGLFPRRDAQEGHGLYAASLNNLLTYTEALRREQGESGVAARFVQARAEDAAYGAGVRWTRLLTLPSLRALRDRLRRLVGADETAQTHAQLAHLVERMIHDPRPVFTLLPGHAVPPSARVQVRPQPPTPGRMEVSPSGELLYGPEPAAAPPARQDEQTVGAEQTEDAMFTPPWITFVGPWEEDEQRLVTKAIRAHEAELETPLLAPPYWICSKRPDGTTAHRAGSAFLATASTAQALAHQLRQVAEHTPDRPY